MAKEIETEDVLVLLNKIFPAREGEDESGRISERNLHSWYAELVEAVGYNYNIPCNIELKQIEQEGGGEGGSEDCHLTFSMKETNSPIKYYTLYYSYQSYDGHNFEYATLNEVTPVDRVKTYYE